jgi:hypothetical protein
VLRQLAMNPGTHDRNPEQAGDWFAAATVVIDDRCFEPAGAKSGHLVAWLVERQSGHRHDSFVVMKHSQPPEENRSG